jgi:hypothetical protein
MIILTLVKKGVDMLELLELLPLLMVQLLPLIVFIWIIGYLYTFGYFWSYTYRNDNSIKWYHYIILIFLWPMQLGEMHSEDKR